MKGNAKSAFICGETINIGDELTVEYTTGKTMKGRRISGKVVEIWDGSDNYLQARLACGWCFHDHDKIISIKRIGA